MQTYAPHIRYVKHLGCVWAGRIQLTVDFIDGFIQGPVGTKVAVDEDLGAYLHLCMLFCLLNDLILLPHDGDACASQESVFVQAV